MNAATQSPNYFNLHVSGIGYMNRIRLVPPSKSAGRKGQSFYACSISALRGSSDEVSYTYFDLRVSGKEAIEMVQKLEFDLKQNRKVFVAVKVGDIYPHLYEREVRDDQGQRTGEREMACLIKGRLLQINSITVDGEKVYQRDPDAPSDSHETDGVDGSNVDAQNRLDTSVYQPTENARVAADAAGAQAAAPRQSMHPQSVQPVEAEWELVPA